MMETQDCFPAVPAQNQFEFTAKEVVAGFANTFEDEVIVEFAESLGNDVVAVESYAA